jgi:hypothetical protein
MGLLIRQLLLEELQLTFADLKSLTQASILVSLRNLILETKELLSCFLDHSGYHQFQFKFYITLLDANCLILSVGWDFGGGKEFSLFQQHQAVLS